MRLSLYIFLAVSMLLITLRLSGSGFKQDSLSNETNTIQVGVNAGFCDKYLWRGMTFNKGLVLQPELVVSYQDFFISSWGNFKIWDVNGDNANEIDFTVGYYHSFNSFDIESFLSYYNFINQPGVMNTAEFNIGLYFPLGDFNLFARTTIDVISNTGGMYSEVGFDYEKEISDKFTFFGTLLTGIGSKKFNEYYLTDWDYPEVGKTSFNLGSCDVGISYSPFKSFYIDADFLLNVNIDKDIRAALGSTSNLVEIVLRKEF